MANGNDVRKLREILRLTQKEFAEKLGVSIKTVANYEAGGVIPMNKQMMIKGMLSSAHNVNIIGDDNISNTGSIGGDISIGAEYENKVLRKRIKELEDELKQIKIDKAILQEFVTVLQNKK